MFDRAIRIASLFTLIVGLLGLASVTPTAQAAPAGERRVFFTDDGRYRCEMNAEFSLAKAVCRNPRNPWGDYFVMLFDKDIAQNRVYMDILRPWGAYESGNMTVQEFEYRYGR